MGKIQQAVNNNKTATSTVATSLKSLIQGAAMQNEFKKALPAVMTPERFIRIANSALSNNATLQSCTPQSFLSALMTSAQLGLEVNTALGQAYIIPYYNGKKGKYECQFQIGYKGLIDLAYRSGMVKTIQAHTVYENDVFDYELGLEPMIKHKPAVSNRGNAIYYYAVIKLKDGGDCFAVASKEDIIAHKAQFSKTRTTSPWDTNFDEMAKKTVLKKALKYAPMKADFARQIATDESVKETISEDMTLEANIIDFTVEEMDETTGEVTEKDKKEDTNNAAVITGTVTAEADE